MEGRGGGEREEARDGSPAANRREDGEGSSVAPAPARHVMRWESFLPRRSLRVLLVEGDDSTRHIVSALLRKCNYRVAGVADGMKAWEVMKEKGYGFDIVLTEVDMPSLSGIGLLTKIVGSEECKNIPVVMMSTHDSINVVLKCMLKGAVDFLVKPVRKNELRNLWQHVWRRHCSNRDMNMLENNTASNQISANAGGKSQTGENSDERSDAQSSGSKREREIESRPKHAEDTHITEREANPDTSDKDAMIKAMGEKEDGNARDYKPAGIRDNVTLPIQKTHVADVSQERNELSGNSCCRDENLALMTCTEGNNDDPKSHCQNNASNESEQNMGVFVEPISGVQGSYAVLKNDVLVEDKLLETSNSSYVNDSSNIGTSPMWELSLRRPQPNDCIQLELKEKPVLKHSVASAFTRYGEKRIHRSVSTDVCIRPQACVEKCHSLVCGHSTGDEKNTSFSHTHKRRVSHLRDEGETKVCFQVSSTSGENATLPSPSAENDCADHSSIVEDTTLHRPQFSFIPIPIPIGPIPYQSLCAGFGGLLQPVFYPETSLAPHNLAAFEKSATQILSTDHSVHHNIQLIKHSSSLDFHHHEVIDRPHHWRQSIDISEPGNLRVLCSHMEQAYQSGSYSQDVLKGGGRDGSGETPDGVGNTGTALESGNESGVKKCNMKVSDCDRSHREAALIKFRMKRKERCFEKKVRYYTRQKLAEQRPRIKGQFVRQKCTESATTAEGEN